MTLILYLCSGFTRSFMTQQHSEVERMRSVTPPLPCSLSQSHIREATLPPRGPHVLLLFFPLFLFIILFLYEHVGSLLVMGVQPVCFTLLPPSALHRYFTFCSQSTSGSGILSGSGSTDAQFQLVVFLLQVW